MAVKDIYQAIIGMKEAEIQDLVRSEIDNQTDIHAILNEGLIAAMDVIGDNFNEGKMFFPEMLLAAQTMKAGLQVLKPHLSESGIPSMGTVVVGTVQGDLHDIGKNLVAMMLEGAGYTIKDMGFDAPVKDFIEASKDEEVKMVAMSALLTTTMPQMRKVIEQLTELGLRERVKVIIGGAPVTQDFADEISADGYGPDGPAAVELARQLIA